MIGHTVETTIRAPKLRSNRESKRRIFGGGRDRRIRRRVWIAGVCAVIALPSFAEEPGAESPTDSQTESPAKGAASGDVPAIDKGPQSWWSAAREELFANIELTDSQDAAIDEILDQAAADRARARRLREIVSRVDTKRAESAKGELKTLKSRLDPRRRIDAMGKVLSDEQRVVFEKNRRIRSDRLFQEHNRERVVRKKNVHNPAKSKVPRVKEAPGEQADAKSVND